MHALNPGSVWLTRNASALDIQRAEIALLRRKCTGGMDFC